MTNDPYVAPSVLKNKALLLLRIFLWMIVTIGIMACVRWYTGDIAQAAVDTMLTVVVLWGYRTLSREYRRYDTVVRIVFLAGIATAFYLFLTHPDTPMRFVWMTTAIYVIFYLFDRSEAFFWIVFMSVILVISYMILGHQLGLSPIELFVWLTNIAIVLTIAHRYASIEEEATTLALNMKEALELEVAKKTKALQRRTRELRELNEKLEERIEAEVQKNREKERMMARQARHAQMGEVLSMIAHQWRQPLNAVATHIAFLQAYVRKAEMDRETLQMKYAQINALLDHLSNTIDDFRHFFKEDRDKKIVALPEIVEDVLDLVRGGLDAKGIAVEVKDGCCCAVEVYPNNIKHVVLNLIQNAADAFAQRNITEKRIEIEMLCKEGHAVLSVEDNAGGIEEAILPKVFEPYFTTKDKSGGTGLGLYMAKVIVEKHCGGTITVTNGEKGARFVVSLPIVRCES